MSNTTVTLELLAIVESLPVHPTSGQLLGALVRAEQAGYARAVSEIREGVNAMPRPTTENGERWDEGFRKGFERAVSDARQAAAFLGGAEIPQGYPEYFAGWIPALARRQAD